VHTSQWRRLSNYPTTLFSSSWGLQLTWLLRAFGSCHSLCQTDSEVGQVTMQSKLWNVSCKVYVNACFVRSAFGLANDIMFMMQMLRKKTVMSQSIIIVTCMQYSTSSCRTQANSQRCIQYTTTNSILRDHIHNHPMGCVLSNSGERYFLPTVFGPLQHLQLAFIFSPGTGLSNLNHCEVH